MRTGNRLVLALLAAALLAGCERSGRTPGENLDRALDKAGDKVKDAGDAIKPK